MSALGADILTSTASLLDGIAHDAAHYGRDVGEPAEAQFAVGLLSLGAVARGSQARQLVLSEKHTVSMLLARGATWAELSKHASVKALQATFDKLGSRLTKQKLGQLLPFAGAVIGGTVGSALADATCQSAYIGSRVTAPSRTVIHPAGRPQMSHRRWQRPARVVTVSCLSSERWGT